MSLKVKLHYFTSESEHGAGKSALWGHKANAPSMTDLKGNRQSVAFRKKKRKKTKKESRIPSHKIVYTLESTLLRKCKWRCVKIMKLGEMKSPGFKSQSYVSQPWDLEIFSPCPLTSVAWVKWRFTHSHAYLLSMQQSSNQASHTHNLYLQ